MTAYKIKPCLLSDADQISLKSILELSHKRLNSSWQLTETGQADLYIYALNNEASSAALQQHSSGFSAVISLNDEEIDGVDIILKKPLRANNFAQTLNKIEEKIKFNNQAQQLAEFEDKVVNNVAKKPGIAKQASSLFSSLSKQLKLKKGPAADLPEINYAIPEQLDNPIDAILDPELLKKWFSDLAEKDNAKIVSAILTNLLTLNRARVDSAQRLALLEVYKTPISRLVFERDINSIKRELESPTEFQKDINALKQLLSELTLGYKIIFSELYHQGSRPQNNDLHLLSIIRIAELTSLTIIHAFRYYRSAPEQTLNDLHQLFIYCETGSVLDKLAATKNTKSDYSFFHYYSQIMLTCIADPFSLAKFDIFRLYKLMERVADKVEINPLTASQVKLNNSFAVVGQFYIDCSADHGPYALAKTQAEQRSLESARIFNPQKAILDIEQLLKTASASNTRGAYDLDMQLLSKVLPQFSTSYERKYQRISNKSGRNIQLANGVDSVYEALSSSEQTVFFDWVMTNQSSDGMMACRHKDEIQAMNNGDFMGIFEQDLPAKLATIRWLHMSNDSSIQIGLQIHPGHPSPISFTVDGETEIKYGLLLPEIFDLKQAPTIIANKGTFSDNRRFRIKQDDETYTINAKELIDSTLSYEQFTFTENIKK